MFKQTMYYGIGIVMMKGISMLMLPYVTRQLTPYQFGTLETLLLLADLIAIVAGMGLIQAMYRFVGSNDDINRRQLVSGCFTLSILIAAGGMVLVAFSLPWLMGCLPVELSGYQVILISIPALLDGVVAIPLTLMRMQAMAKWFCIVSVAKAVVQALMSIYLLEIGWGIDAILIAGACSSVLLMGCLVRYQWLQMAGLGQLRQSWKLLKYGGPVVIGMIGLYAITGLDRWILAERVGTESLTFYAVAVKFSLILSLVMQPFTLWWFPNRFQILQEEGGKQRCADNALLGTNIGIFTAAVMILTVPALIGLLLPSDYQESASLVVGLLIACCLKNAGDLMNMGCYHGNSNSELVWIQWGCAVLAVAGYLWLIPVFGLWAAVWVLVGVYGVRLLLLYVFSQMSLPLPYRYSDLLKTSLVSVAGYGVYRLIASELELWSELAAGCVLSLIMLVVLMKLRVFPNILEAGRAMGKEKRAEDAFQ